MSGLKWLAAMLMCWACCAQAEQRVAVCYNYGCLAQAEVVYDDGQLRELGEILASAQDAAEERAAIAVAIGRLLGWAGKQSPIFADRGGNYDDDGGNGGMDCIDHSTTTTRLLQMMAAQGWLRFHRVLEPVLRSRFLIFAHYSALIEQSDENDPATPEEERRYVVDSWFFDNGQPAVVMPLAQWQAGEYPHGAKW
jgi:hypothetical protein